MSLSTITEAPAEIPVRACVDVLVCGGGTAGCIAALAAARRGARVLLVEGLPFLGGVNTAAQVNGVGGWQYELDSRPLIGGLPMEVMRRLAEMGGADPETVGFLSQPKKGPPDYTEGGLGCFWIRVNPEYTKILYDRLMKEAGVEVLLCASVVKPIVEDGRLRGAFLESKSGREAVLAGVVVDCTGDGDVAARAGAAFAMGRPGDGACQPMTQMFTLGNCEPPEFWWGKEADDPDPDSFSRHRYRRAIELARERGEFLLNPNDMLCAATPVDGRIPSVRSVNFTRVQHHRSTDVAELTAALMEGREQVMEALAFVKKYVRGCREAVLLQNAAMIGIRESRRILGDHVLTAGDVRSGRDFADGIARGIYLLDIHNPSEFGKPSALVLLEQPYSVPYRALLPLGLENLLVAGRCISGDHVALASYRVQSHAMAIGEAAGTAAGMAARQGVTPRALSTRALRDALRGNGANVGVN